MSKLNPLDPYSTQIKHHQDIIFKILLIYLSTLELEMLEMLDDTSITYTMVRMITAATAVTRMMFWGVDIPFNIKC